MDVRVAYDEVPESEDLGLELKSLALGEGALLDRDDGRQSRGLRQSLLLPKRPVELSQGGEICVHELNQRCVLLFLQIDALCFQGFDVLVKSEQLVLVQGHFQRGVGGGSRCRGQRFQR